MESRENSSPTSPHKDTPNPNPKLLNINIKVDEGLT